MVKIRIKVNPGAATGASSVAGFDTRSGLSSAQEHSASQVVPPIQRLPPQDMAPVGQTEQKVVEEQLKDVIQDFFQIMIQVQAYDLAGKPSKDTLQESIKQLHKSLQKVHSTASSSSQLPNIPPELIQYVDNGRNPDIYTREFVELARRGNQLMKGKLEAFGSFRDVLAGEMGRAMPELRGDVGRVLDETGGKKEVVLKEEES